MARLVLHCIAALQVRPGADPVGAAEIGKMARNDVGDGVLERRRGQTPAPRIRPARDQPVRDVVSDLSPMPPRMRRGQPIAGFVTQLARERRP